MIFIPTFVTLMATVSLTYAHTSFVRIAHNGVWQPPLKYIRNTTAPWYEPGSKFYPGADQWAYPTYPQHSAESIRCGRDNMAWAKVTETLQVKPGDTVDWVPLNPGSPPNTWDNPEMIQWENCPDGKGACKGSKSQYEPSTIWHGGPLMMHLSRVPAEKEIQDYDGSGEWTKIYTLGLEIRGKQAYWNGAFPPNGQTSAPHLIATIPKQTPAGRYLLRVDTINIGSIPDGSDTNFAEAEVYPACAHIEVLGEVEGGLPEGVKIPEALKTDQPGMATTPKIFENWPENFIYPGGPLWDGEKLEQDHGPHCTGCT